MTTAPAMALLAEHVSERGLLEFSIPAIARLAGVSHRTVYNYFPNREALLDEFSAWAIDAVTGLLAVLGSSRTWHRLTSDHGLDGSQAGVATGWLIGLGSPRLTIPGSTGTRPRPWHGCTPPDAPCRTARRGRRPCWTPGRKDGPPAEVRALWTRARASRRGPRAARSR